MLDPEIHSTKDLISESVKLEMLDTGGGNVMYVCLYQKSVCK